MTITNSSLRLAALVAGVAVALALMGAVAIAPVQAAGLTQVQIQSITSLLASFGADAATIANVTAALNGQATPGTGSNNPNTGACPALSRSLQQGSSGADVKALQMFLNGNAQTQVSVSGAGSPGNESTYFGAATKAAVTKFQTLNNVSAIGIVGPATRAAIAAVCGNGTPGVPTVPGTGGSVSVSAGAQPVNSLAVASAARVPFTTFTISNNSSAAVLVNSVTVQRVGLGVDANFSGVVLLDSNGLQIGNAKTLNSNHQANIGDSGFTLGAGQSMTFTVAGNIAAAATAQSGQVVALQVVAINTGATVSGSLPITGASQTINTTLTLGSVSTSTSAFDPGVAQTKNIGDAGIKFSGVKFTAGSAEDLKLYSIRWRQVGSVTSSDLANVVTVVNGTSYPATVDATGKYYTTIFPGGIMIPKGDSLDAYIQGDVVGSNASGRNVDFDLDKVTDVYFVGQLYGYGVAPSGSFTPWYNGYVVTLSGASVTTINKDNAGVNAAQNIAVNVSNQPLGGYTIDLKGEAISVGSTVVTFATTTASTGLLTNVSIVNANGSVVAGPVDTTWVSGVMTATFTDTITYPLGKNTYSIRGKVPSTATNGATVAATTVPSSGWTSMTGQSTGNSVSLTNASFTMNTMTVKAGSLAIAVSSTPAAQNVVAGAQQFTFANIQLDASQSGEDVRISTIGLTASTSGALSAASILTSCQLWDGTTALNGGSNVVNPTITATAFTASTATFTLDSTLVVPKSTVKTLALKCNVASGATGSLKWGITTAQVAALAVTGVSSGATITASGTTNNGQLMTLTSTGSVVASTDSSSPSYAIAAGSQTGVTLGVMKLRATNEDVSLTRIGLKLTNTASSSASDLTQVYLYKGATLIGTASFVGGNVNATSTLSAPLTLARDTDTVITVKADIAALGTSQPGVVGHLIAVDVDTAGTNTQGTGGQSGSTINATGSTAVSGVRIFKSFPTVAKGTLPSNNLSNGEQKLLRFMVTANANGDLGIARFALTIATTTVNVTGIDIFAYTDSSYSTPVTGLSSDGGMEATDLALTTSGEWTSSASELEIDATTSGGASTTVQVPAGSTRYFEVRGTVSNASSGDSIQTTLLGDAAFPVLAASTFMGNFTTLNADSNDDFIWSPNSTSTAVVADLDWTNGFGVVGLPSSGLSETISL